jgi:hypothetical protein
MSNLNPSTPTRSGRGLRGLGVCVCVYIYIYKHLFYSHPKRQNKKGGRWKSDEVDDSESQTQ